MFGIFVNESGGVAYAAAIVSGYKTIETRSRNMLRRLVGERVAVIKTRNGKKPLIVGYVDIVAASWCSKESFRQYENFHLVPSGSRYDADKRGKWFYHLENPERLEKPIPIPDGAIYHGRSYCEF